MACRLSGYGSPLFQWLWFLQGNMDFLYCPQSYHICNRSQHKCETQVPLWYIFTLCLSYEGAAYFIKRNTPPTNIDIIIDHCGVRTQCHSLLSSKTSCPQIFGLWDMCLKLSNHSDIWQAHQQHCIQTAFQISKWLYYFHGQSYGF